MLPEQELIALLRELSLTVSVAESCTGGLIAKRLTDVAGASAVFPGGVVSYSSRIKHELLGVPEETLHTFTAVSSEVAAAMARGVCRCMHTDFGISVTGYAGPGDADEPTGLVFVGCACGDAATVRRLHLEGDRETIRSLAATEAITLLLTSLKQI